MSFGHAAAFTLVRHRCQVQLVLLGTGIQRATIMRRALAQGVGTSVHVERDLTGERWADLIAAADVVVPSVAAGPITLLDVPDQSGATYRNGLSCKGSRPTIPPSTHAAAAGRKRGMIMRNIVSRLILWLAEILDGNLVTVPDIDL